MLTLMDIRQYISNFGIVTDDNVYIGKLDNKKQKSIGVYPRGGTGPPVVALGGASSYDRKAVSLLLHWNKNPDETEKTAYMLFEKLREVSNITIGTAEVRSIMLMVPEPQSVGTDDSGVYEYVIWIDFVYGKER